MYDRFDPAVAKDVGVNAALLYFNIKYWCDHNRKNGINEHEGLFWTYNSMKAFSEQFDYLSEKQIRSALNLLEEKGYIKSSNYNKSSYDRTKWYADLKWQMESDKREDCICPVGQMDLTEKANGFDADGKPIPIINTNIKPNNNGIYMCDKPKQSRFIPPTLEEVSSYCRERNNNIDPEAFIDYYSSQKWKKANGRPVENWQACIRTWERKNKDKPKSSGNEFIDLLNKWEVEENG